jgi:hypothetical protein
MWYFYRSVISLFLLLFTSGAYAFDVFLEPLYWQANEDVYWAYINSKTSPDQTIQYLSNSFDYAPGFRVGLDVNDRYGTSFYYTKYDTQANESANGNLVSAFIGSTADQPYKGYTYDAGQEKLNIAFNMFDWDLNKRFYVNDVIMIKPLVGLAGGWINQDITADFQGSISTTEKISNDFTGIGPKAGIETELTLYNKNQTQIKFLAGFTAYYLWGHWNITDELTDSVSHQVNTDVDDKNMGALALQATAGLKFIDRKFSASLGYEIDDWFNQLQIFDDATGAHDNDLTLQGLTLKLAYNF